ncbi:hypothetical protein THRCLA_10722 [Thraustotheca clavata]|uniref:START domain-containing protein n=1 Tax=Thraustotheca clavata TaxID=74557 RepID=A0A1V9YHV9_9STRA|nr:hypothetical protein THRCLA_10722 [Thraustotheca clavata]
MVQSLVTLRKEADQLESQLASKLYEKTTNTNSTSQNDRREDQLLAMKKYYVHENMQLRETLKSYEQMWENTGAFMSRIGMVRPLFLDDAFVKLQVMRVKAALDPMNLRQYISQGKNIQGWDCVSWTQTNILVYDIEKYFPSLSMGVMADYLWHVYQDSATYVQLADLILDHQIVRRIGDNILVIWISTWLTSIQQAIPMYLILHREQRPTDYTMYVATLRPDLEPNPHTFLFHGEQTPYGYKSTCRGMYCLTAGSTVDADMIVQQMIFCHCRFEALLKTHTRLLDN